MNNLFMRKFWRHCRKESAENEECITMGQRGDYSFEDCLQLATRMWRDYPFLTEVQECTAAILQGIYSREDFNASKAQTNPAYKLMEMVARFTADVHWSAACALICYKYSQTLEQLSDEKYKLLEELYDRITGRRTGNEELHDILLFWYKLNEFGKNHRRYIMQISSDQIIRPAQAARLLEKFKYDELWYELTEKQQERDNWKSTVTSILHRRTGWKHAAQAIMQHPLPALRKENHPSDYFPEHIDAIEEFAQESRMWLHSFASSLCEYQKTEKYKRSFDASMTAIEKRTKFRSREGL